MHKVYNLNLELNWALISNLSRIERFDSEWFFRSQRESQNLSTLKEHSCIKSVASSARIEGSTNTNEDVEFFLTHRIKGEFVDRDKQEISGYFDALDYIFKEYSTIELSKESLNNIHTLLLNRPIKTPQKNSNSQLSENDDKPNFQVEKKLLISKTIRPDSDMNDGLSRWLNWYNNDNETHPIIKIAISAYDIFSSSPFKEANAKMSRLISVLLLLQNGYSWIEYISLEEELEKRKNDYFQIIKSCSLNRPNENISPWIHFFLTTIQSLQQNLLNKLDYSEHETMLTPKQKSILVYIADNSGSSSGKISKHLKIPNPTVKRLLAQLVTLGFLEKFGVGRGTSYSIL